MCNPASFILTKDNVLFSRTSDSHDVIIADNYFRDDFFTPQFVRVEVTPPDRDFSRPFHEWRFRTDQDLLPDWYDPEEAEAACRRRLPLWARWHLKIIGQGVFGDGVTRDLIAYNGSLDLCETNIKYLPDDLIIEGDLYLEYSRIKKLPNNLTVGYTLNISYTWVTEIPEGLKVGGSLFASGISIKRVSDSAVIRGNVFTNDLDLWRQKNV